MKLNDTDGKLLDEQVENTYSSVCPLLEKPSAYREVTRTVSWPWKLKHSAMKVLSTKKNSSILIHKVKNSICADLICQQIGDRVTTNCIPTFDECHYGRTASLWLHASPNISGMHKEPNGLFSFRTLISKQACNLALAPEVAKHCRWKLQSIFNASVNRKESQRR